MNKFNSIFIEKSKIVDCIQKGKLELSLYVKDKGVPIEEFILKIPKDQKFIAVVGGGMSAEREVSFMSSNGIVDSLLELGYAVIFVDMGADIASVLQKLRPHAVYNALHGTYGEDGCLPGLLNILRINYTGPGVLASALALNKKKSNEIFIANNIRVPDSIIVQKRDNTKGDPMPRPYVIKPISQGSSIGVEVIFKEDKFSFADYKFDYGDEILVEQYIKGRELQVAVLNGKAMGVLEIKMLQEKRFYDYEAKYTEGFTQHIMPAPLEPQYYQEALMIAEKACKIFDCISGIIRVELIYDEQENKLYLLEINTHPGMTPLSICPEILAYEGVSYTTLVDNVLKEAKFAK